MEADTTIDPVLADVERFLQVTGIAPTAFGQRALNDPTFVHELRRGRECKRATRARIRDFIQSFSATNQGEAA